MRQSVVEVNACAHDDMSNAGTRYAKPRVPAVYAESIEISCLPYQLPVLPSPLPGELDIPRWRECPHLALRPISEHLQHLQI